MDIIEKLKKIQLLAVSGVDGEKLSAQNLLNELLKKHGLSFTDIHSDTLLDRSFVLANSCEATLFHHCLLKFFGKTDVYEAKKNKLNKFVRLTSVQYALFLDFFNYHAQQFRTETAKMEQNVLFAYVNKHVLFADNCETYTLNEDNFESFQTLLKMLDDVSYYKRLA